MPKFNLEKQWRNKLDAIIHILKGRPTMYRIKLVKSTARNMVAIENYSGKFIECHNVNLDTTGYPNKVIVDGITQYDPDGSVFFGNEAREDGQGILLNPPNPNKVSWVEISGERQWWNPRTQQWQKEKP